MWLYLACADPDDTAPDADADTDVDADTDADTDPVVIDTGLALTYYEGVADVTTEAWVGEEAYVATAMDGTAEHCRVINTTAGEPYAEPCVGCSFAFAVTMGAGRTEGDACENVSFLADMFEGDEWLYAFAPVYVYGPYGYTYENVFLFGEETDDGVTWTPWADAHSDGKSRIFYESTYAYTTYYRYFE
jgi:hypothetical protein